MNIREQFLADKHRLLVEALRAREQGVLQYVIMLVSGLGGYTLWISKYRHCEDLLLIGTIGTLILLTTGAVYAYYAAYNYRCFLLQVAKLEHYAGIDDQILRKWRPEKIYQAKPPLLWFGPDVINVFWWAFIISGGAVILANYLLSRDQCTVSKTWAIGVTYLFINTVCLLVVRSKWRSVREAENR